MSFILSCDFWFCCGGAKDEPADRYHQPPPHPSSQTQMVAVAQQAPPVAQQPSQHQMPPHLVAPPLPPPAMGYAIPPPHQATPWSHVPRTGSYDPPHPVFRQPSSPAPTATMVSYNDLPMSPRTVLRPSKPHHDLFLPSIETTAPSRVPLLPSTKAQVLMAQHPDAQQAPWPARQPSNKDAIKVVPPNEVPSKRYEDETPSPTRATSVVHHDPSTTRSTQNIPSGVSSMKIKKAYDEPPPAPVVTSQRPPQATWPTRQPSKTYQTQPGPPQVSYDTPVPAVVLRAEVFPPAASSMAPRAPQHPQSL